MTLTTPSITTTITRPGITTTTKVSVPGGSLFPKAVINATIPSLVVPTTSSVGGTRLFFSPEPPPPAPLSTTEPTLTTTPTSRTTTPGIISTTSSVSSSFTTTSFRPVTSSVISFPLGQLQENTGIQLNETEKPKIVCIIANNFVSGLPQKNTLILKRFTPNNSSTYEISYRVLRKNILIGETFQIILNLTGSFTTISDELYQKISDNISIDKNNLFTVDDLGLLPHTSYAYRLECDFSRDLTRFVL